MGAVFKRTNAAGSTWVPQKGAGNFQSFSFYLNGEKKTITHEGWWKPKGTGEANMGNNGITPAPQGGASVITRGGTNRSKGNSQSSIGSGGGTKRRTSGVSRTGYSSRGTNIL